MLNEIDDNLLLVWTLCALAIGVILVAVGG